MEALSPPPIDGSPVVDYLERLREDLLPLDDGAVADFIPELASADPSSLGIAIAMVDGQVWSVGDERAPFTIQSIAKPFVYGLALEDQGRDSVLRKVGVEPSGNPFNSIAFDEETNRPFNPMVNAGAIATTALVAGEHERTQMQRITTILGTYAGRDLTLDEKVYESERSTGDRNRAIAYLMRSLGILECDADAVLDLYFRQCSLLVTCRDVAVMAATLANSGVNPVTGVRALEEQHVERVLSVMSTCGMYDYTGEWVYSVGLPAKSGVAGGIVAVLPGQLGIGVFSPPLDTRGNSVRGVRACARISVDFGLHVLRPQNPLRSVVRRVNRGDVVRSNRIRTEKQDALLADIGDAIAVVELQGDLFFSSMERAYRAVVEVTSGVEFVVVDLRRISAIDAAAGGMLDALAQALATSGRTLVLTHLESFRNVATPPGAVLADDLDGALEWCEERLLEGFGTHLTPAGGERLADHEILRGLAPPELEAIERACEIRTLPPGESVFREGDPADALFFVLSGLVSVRLDLAGSPRSHRLATFGPGGTFGEMAMLDEGTRSADVVADDETTVASLSLESFDALAAAHPQLAATIYRNLARNVSRRLRSANDQIRALDG